MGIRPRLSGTLLVTALLVALGFLLIVRPMVRDGLPGDYETRQGDVSLSAGDFAAAMERFDAALAVSPGHRGAMMGRAIVMMQTSRTADAEATFEALIEQLTGAAAADDPTGRGALAAAYANRGILRDRDGRYEAALADYRQALRIDQTAVDGPGLIDRVLRGDPRPSTVAKRAAYLEAELKKPESERRLKLPEADERQRMYKP
jgi:Putative Zn-dependent protease, contains TPR repeats